MTSQDGPSHGDSESRQYASSREEERASEGAFTLTDLITAIHAIGETRREMAETIKDLKRSMPKPSEENEKLPQVESAAAGKGSEQKGPSFVTQKDPYPKGYEAPTFVLFNGRKGSPKEHVNCFIDALGPHAGSIHSWENLASRFCKKYFQHEERVTTTQLNNTRQKDGEDPLDFVRRFRDLALDCYDEKDEEALVEICISNIVADYRVYLENIGISQFSWLLEAVRKTSMSVKPT
ncbi:unnamed protein product [Prunus brigantina]